MNVIVRKIAATPKRTAIEAWQIITELISESSSPARKELEAAGGIAASVIAEDITKTIPIILTGDGPRLRFYCIYGEDALDDSNCREDAISHSPTATDWHLYLPCNKEDLSWISASLASISPNISAYDREGSIEEEKEAEEHGSMKINTNILRNKL